jgi:hypothetical protein
MLAYHREVGESFDMQICERDLMAAFKMAVDEAPKTERCVIQDMGDFTHYENELAQTEASGHALDADGRYRKMIRVYIRLMRFMCDYALTRFKYVDVIINQGNHSRKNDHWMSEILSVFYTANPRLTVLSNESVFIPYRMGNTFVMSHHSDKCKPKQLAQVMSTDFAEDWGEAEYRYIDIGHIHHNMVLKEHAGVTVESFNQLATADKYAHDGGWRSRSCLTVVVRSKTYGEVSRFKIPLERVRDVVLGSVKGENVKNRREVHTV